jgi:predicted ribosome quality control (RQC) complex YloA/Tae2 family protein
MKAMSVLELKTLVNAVKAELVGAQLQEIVSNDRGMAMCFHSHGPFWMVLDMNPGTPFCLVFPGENPLKKGPKPKPTALFLNSHAKNLYLRKIWLEESLGRVVKIELANTEKIVTLELILIPKQANLLVQAEGKSIAWEKPREVKAHGETGELPSPRSLPDIHAEWLAAMTGGTRPAIDPKAQWEKKRQKDLEKKRKALCEIENTLRDNVSSKLSELGELLKSFLPGDFKQSRVPDWAHAYLDFRQNLFANIQSVFEKSKHAAAKVQGTSDRKNIVIQEIAKLEKMTFEQSTSLKGPRKLDDLMEKIEAKGRKLHLESGAIVYCGKSAADNLALLRRAKAWDYWLHLKDYPGAHAIIHRSRDQEIPLVEIQKAALWVLKESVSNKTVIEGQKYAVVVVECRFVRPIKGDKLGRVTYHSEKQWTISAKL